MIINLLSLGATTADDLNNDIIISVADKRKLAALGSGSFRETASLRDIPQMIKNAVVFADTDWTSGTWTVAVNFQGANGELVVCTTGSGEILADGLIYLTPAAGYLQNASSEFMLFPLSGPSGELPQVDVTEATAGALVTLDLYLMIPDF